MSPTIHIIRKLTSTMRTFYCIYFTDGGFEVFDDETKRDQWFKHYWHECGRTGIRIEYSSVAEVEQCVHDNETTAEYRLNRKLSEAEVKTINRMRASFLAEQQPYPIVPMDALDGVFERTHTTAEEDIAEARERFAELFAPNLNEMLRKLGYLHGQTGELDMVLLEDIVMHPEFIDGELDRCIAVFKAEPNQDNMLLVRGAMHVYEWLNIAA